MSKVFIQANIRKATGQDGIPGRVLRACVEQLSGIFTILFNLSFSQSVIPMSQTDLHHSCSQELLTLPATMTTTL